jgi:hypothetical protein
MIQSDDPLPEHENRRRESGSSLRAQVDTLHGALVQAREGGEYDTAQLRDEVAAVATAARDEHVPPERLLVLLKRLTRDDALDVSVNGGGACWPTGSSDGASRRTMDCQATTRTNGVCATNASYQ